MNQNQQVSKDLLLTKEPISNKLAILDTTKSIGSVKFHSRILPETRNEIAQALCNLMQDWKYLAIHKKKDAESDPNIYRPKVLRQSAAKLCRK